MEHRIELEMRGRDPAEIFELNLDNTRSTSIEGLTDKLVNLEVLSLINVGLTSLKGLPALPSLKRLELSDNRISNGFDILAANAPSITHLNLSGNKIKDMEALKPLGDLTALRALDLFNCEVVSAVGDGFRKEIFALIPCLMYLDGYDKDDQEASDEDDDDGAEGNESGDDDDEGSDGEEVGLEYLNSTAALQDEDETEDFNPEDDESGDQDRGKKRKHDEEEDDEEDEDEEE